MPVSAAKVCADLKDYDISQLRRRYEEAFDNRDFTEECQGVSNDARYWYFSANAKGNQRVYRVDKDYRVVSSVGLGGLKRSHIGDIDVKERVLYGALEGSVGVLVLPISAFDNPKKKGNAPRAYSLLGADGKKPPQGDSMPWCVSGSFDGAALQLWRRQCAYGFRLPRRSRRTQVSSR
ncbi:MAG: hypothetical protein QM784_21135 [Polyangiaceae bacterium]